MTIDMSKICSVDSCNNAQFVRGMCRAHYLRWYRHGSTDRKHRATPCAVFDCQNMQAVKGLCKAHHARMVRRGSAELHPKFGVGETPEARFWSKAAVTANPDRCWIWQRTVRRDGYGKVWFSDHHHAAHRLAFFFTHRRHPDAGLFVLHSCDNKLCINPSHLREGTHEDNMRDVVLRQRRKQK